MEKKMLFIYNPKSGKAKIRNKLADILDVFGMAGYEITVFPTQRQGHATEIISRYSSKPNIVVCSGGDGTLDEVVTGMIEREWRIPLGYIPAGSTNDFGRSLSLPQDMVKAAQMIVEGKTFACDVGHFNGDVFVYIAAFGLFTEVSYETGQQMKNVLGHMAYLLEGVKSLPSIRSYHMRITSEDKEIEDDFIFGMVTNSRSVGGFKRITGKNVKMDDGVFEVTLIKKPKNPIELNTLMVSFLNKDIDSNVMYCFTASQITIECQDEIAWTLDGEYGGHHKKAVIENQHKGMNVRVENKE